MNMIKQENDWIEDVMHSYIDKQEVSPRDDLFDDILSGAKVRNQLPIFFVQMSSAAAIALLLVNSWVLNQYVIEDKATEDVVMSLDGDFLSEYNYYDYE